MSLFVTRKEVGVICFWFTIKMERNLYVYGSYQQRGVNSKIGVSIMGGGSSKDINLVNQMRRGGVCVCKEGGESVKDSAYKFD